MPLKGLKAADSTTSVAPHLASAGVVAQGSFQGHNAESKGTETAKAGLSDTTVQMASLSCKSPDAPPPPPSTESKALLNLKP